ncbi:MAG TPA: hypothetical protein VFT99_22475, partial [Roseiflexaceae bacterium]|nr:hypothetical protein [Roseiflexaceae bacterium]
MAESHSELLDRIARLLGLPLTGYRTIQGGYSLALRLRCDTASGSVFVKVGRSAGTNAALRREIEMYQRV